MNPRREVIIREYDPQDKQSTATQGQKGDTELAHVNPWEQALLQRLGGAGTRNPRTGLKQFYLDPNTGMETGNSINFPTDIFPYSTSQNTAGGTQQASNYGYNTAQNTSNQASSNYSGLPSTYRDALLSAISPQLTSAVTNMPANIDAYTNQALGSYQQMLNSALKTGVPNILSNLANRGILNATEGQGVMGNFLSNAALDASNKGYQTAMQAALLKANMPQVLAQLMGLGQYSGGTSTGTAAGTSTGVTGGQSTGTNYSQGGAYSADPTVMYRTMADLLSRQF